MNSIYDGIMSHVPDDKLSIVRAGIGLFELSIGRKEFQDYLLIGTFNCQVLEDDDGDVGQRFKVMWNTGRNAIIRYSVDDKGNCTAWMPDDPFWHNRVSFLNNKFLRPGNLHTRDHGIIPSQQVTLEIDCLGEELQCARKIYKLFINNNPKDSCYFYNKEDADIEKEKIMQNASQITVEGKTLQPKTRSVVRVDIKEGTKIDYKPEVSDLIKKYGRLQFGWTQCQQFVEVIKPKVIERIKEKQDMLKTKDKKSVFIEAIESMSDDEKDSVLTALTKKKKKEKE